MTLYVETSAVLRWLFGEPDAEAIAAEMDGAGRVVSSMLTVIEIKRALVRAEDLGLITPTDRERLLGQFASACHQWSFLSMTVSVADRAGRPFPQEPLRSLDAIHLASALELSQLFPDVKMLSCDERILKNLPSLGMPRAGIPG